VTEGGNVTKASVATPSRSDKKKGDSKRKRCEKEPIHIKTCRPKMAQNVYQNPTWISIGIHGYQWTSVNYNLLPPMTVYCCQLPCTIVSYHHCRLSHTILQFITVLYHRLLPTVVYLTTVYYPSFTIYVLQSTTIYYHLFVPNNSQNTSWDNNSYAKLPQLTM